MKYIEWIVNRIKSSQYERAWNEFASDEETYKLEAKSGKELCDWMRGYPPGSPERLLGEIEMRRRDSAETRLFARISILLSVGAFGFSVAVYFASR